MIQLLEDFFGFTDDRLGFPSIGGCRAVVFQTSSGLFGYHNKGGTPRTVPGRDPAMHLESRVTEFVEYVRSRGSRYDKPLALSVTTFVGRTYGIGEWHQEAAMFAAALGYKGELSGVDLCSVYDPSVRSAYVEVRRVGSTHYIFCTEWDPSMAASEDLKENQDLRVRPATKRTKMCGPVTIQGELIRPNTTKLSAH